jgi:hypothetical protein
MAEKVKELKRKRKKCPPLDTKGRWIKSITPAPKKGPDATAPKRKQLPRVIQKYGGAFGEWP